MLENSIEIDDWFIQQSRMMNQLDKIAGEFDVSFLQYEILLHVSQYSGSTPTKISEYMQVSRSSVSRSLKTLQRKNLIERVHGVDNDQRQIEITITDGAKVVINSINDALTDIKI